MCYFILVLLITMSNHLNLRTVTNLVLGKLT